MEFSEYQEQTATTAIYPGKGQLTGLMYVALGLCGEAGEVANKVKKILRDFDGVVTEEMRLKLLDELGDTQWYLAQCVNELKASLDRVGESNLAKLANRFANGTLHGSGDAR